MKWSPELRGQAQALSDRGGGPDEAVTVRRPAWWKPGKTASTTTAARNRRGHERGMIGRRLDAALGKVEEPDE